MKRIFSIALALCMAMSLFIALPAAAIEEADGWELIKELPFTQEAENAGNYSVSPDETKFEKTYSDDGMILKALTDDSGSDTFVEFNYAFGQTLNDGRYYVEFEFTENAPTSGSLNATVRGDSEAFTWAISKSSPVGIAARTDGTSETAGGWGTVPASEKPSHTSGAREKQGVIFDTSDQSLVLYKDDTAVTGNKLYTRYIACVSIDKMYFKFQTAKTDDSYTFHGIKVYQFTGEVSDAEKLATDMATVTESSILGGQQKSSITTDLTLPASPLANGTTVTWESSDTAVISNDGVVTRQEEDTAVTFTGHFVNGTATEDMVLTLNVKGTSGENSDWILWNEIIFDSLNSSQYTLATDANYEYSITDGALMLTKLTDVTADFNGAVTVPIPSDHPIGDDATYYMEFVYELSGTNMKLLANYQSGGSYVLSMTSQYNSGTIGLAAHTSSDGTGTGNWLGNAYLPGYTHGQKTTFGVLYDTSDSSLVFYKDGEVVNNGTKVYTRTPGLDALTQLKFGPQDINKETAITAAGATAKFYSFKVWKMDNSLFLEDYNYLTIDKLTDEPASMITKNLNPLPTILPNGTIVNWTISDPAAVKQDGTVTPGSNGDISVKLTAELSRGSFTDTKEFNLVILEPGKADRYLYVDSDTFDTEADFAVWNFEQGDSVIACDDGRLYMRRTTANQDVSATKYFVTHNADERFAAVGDNVTVEYQLEINENLRELKSELFDMDDNVLSDLMITDAGSNDDTNATLTVSYNNGSADTTATRAYTDNTAISVKYEINTTTGAMKIYIDGALVADGYVKNNAKNVSAIKFSTGYADRYGVMLLDNLNLLVETSDQTATAVTLDKENLTFDRIKGAGKNTEDVVVENLKLITAGWLGSEITWVSSNEAVISSTGVVTRTNQDETVTLTATLKNGTATETTSFQLIVKGVDENNMAATGTVTVSSGSDTASNANDALMDTAWTAGSSNPYLRVDFGEAKLVSRVILNELDVAGSYLVTGYVIEVSDNGTDWTTVSEGTSVGANHVIDFQPVEARYVRYRVTSQNSGRTGLYEIEVYFEPTDVNRVKADMEWLKTVVTEYAVSSPLDLPTVGKFGSEITWKSSNTGVMSDDGSVFIQPAKNTTFVMTATVKSNSYSETQPFTKMASGSNSTTNPSTGGGGGSRGGSSSAVSTGGELVNVVTNETNLPTDPVDPDNYGTFHDVPKDSWSYEYIEALAEKGIVDGYAGSFNPGNSVTREEFVKMLLGVLGIEATETETAFNDVNADEWYAPYVATAEKLGIVDGTGEGVFGVGQTIIRQDIAVMVQRALEVMEITLNQNAESIVFDDAQSISDYAKEAVELLVRAGIVSGDENNNFNPTENLTREQAAKIICLSGGVLNEE